MAFEVAGARQARRVWQGVCLAMALSMAGIPAAQAATSVSIWPVDPVIEHGQRAVALWLENRDTKPVTLQVRVLGWRQDANGDAYDDNQERVIGSPPMTVVPPGKRQLIRLMRVADTAPGTEESYRVLIDEVPQPHNDADDNGATPSFGIQLQMHYSIPLFIDGEGIWTKEDPLHHRDPATAAQPVLGWHIERDGAKRWLVVSNRGAVHARLTGIAFETNGQRIEVERGLLGYVLPGARSRWALAKDQPAGAQPKLIATVNGRPSVVIAPDAGPSNN